MPDLAVQPDRTTVESNTSIMRSMTLIFRFIKTPFIIGYIPMAFKNKTIVFYLSICFYNVKLLNIIVKHEGL